MNEIAVPLKVGPVEVRNRIFLAPMSGVSDLPFRKRAFEHGAGLVVSEMVASEELCKARAESRMRASNGGLPIHMLQLAGREAKWMAEAARIAEGEGADIIDINMGCPAKKVTGGYSGSALMRDLDHAQALIDATVGAVSVPVTLKMRLGWDEHTINAPELAKRAEDAGVRMITIHGRTRAQLYNGRADWRRVADVRDVVSIPLVVNGDIGCLADARRALALSGADAVMIGRAAYGQPWLPGEIAREAGFSGAGCIAAPGRDDMAAYVTNHYEDMLSQYGAETGTRHARKHLGWYLDRHAPISRDMSAIRKQIMTSNRSEEVIRLISVVLCETSNETVLPAEAA
ncbi:tRNA dihydrouridine synthase DusB [Oricola nitratireducens]|uniref:tRNA dihydrouridine synthase DusB n=1 Tax=Oricola nitratireducens TaxID=2775868 RepID=UPI0018661A3F|nr:tRNA dihydrouridine synthase DusB [Oricola nitratireducens]